MRFLASSALLLIDLALGAQGCSLGRSCTEELRGFEVTLQRRTTGPGLRIADVVQVQGCVGSRCATASAPYGAGWRAFETETYRKGQVQLTEVDGQVQIDARFIVEEGQNPVSIRLIPASGPAHVLSASIDWDDDGCHESPTSTAL